MRESDGNRPLVILLLYVDDMLLFSPCMKELESVMKLLSNRYEMSSMREAPTFLSSEGRISSSPSKANISEILKMFNIERLFSTTSCKLDQLATHTDCLR